MGNSETALVAVEEGVAFATRTNQRLYLSELYRLKGELVSTEREAVICFNAALTIAREQQSKLFELRAARTLAAYWLQKSMAAEARNLLTPVYAWFSEGLDTPNLSDSKIFLDAIV